MSKYLMYFIVLFALVLDIKAETQENNTFYGTRRSVTFVNRTSGTSFSYGGSYTIGTEGINQGTLISQTYRTTYEFDFSAIPLDANNFSIGLDVTTQTLPTYYSNLKLSITNPSSQIEPNNSSWNAITSATQVAGSISYSYAIPRINNSTITSIVSEAIKSRRKLYLGIYSDNEYDSHSNADFSLSIFVSYSVPPPIVNVRAQAFTNFAGGSITVDGAPLNSGDFFTRVENENVSLSAPDQTVGGYNYFWKTSGNYPSNWSIQIQGSPEQFLPDRNINVKMSKEKQGAVFTAFMRKIYSVSFQKQTSSSSLQIPITINGTTYTNSTPQFNVQQYEPITVTVPSTIEENNIIFKANNASSGSTTTYTFYPEAHSAVPIGYIGYADKAFGLHILNSGPGVSVGIGMSWNEYPNSNVTQYQIYRSTVQQNGPGGDASVIAIVSRGTTSYVDMTATYDPRGNYNISYEVLPYYAPDNTYSNVNLHNLVSTVGLPWGFILEKKSETAELVKEYSLSNYPNPFNPNTMITYSLKNSHLVSVKVFDILGNLISDLVNEFQEAGKYSVNFNGNGLPSGFYLVSIKAGEYSNTRKILLMK